MEPNPYEAQRELNLKRQLSLHERLGAFPGWGRIALLFLIVSVLTVIFCLAFLYVLAQTPL
jgi:hypothetical protein